MTKDAGYRRSNQYERGTERYRVLGSLRMHAAHTRRSVTKVIKSIDLSTQIEKFNTGGRRICCMHIKRKKSCIINKLFFTQNIYNLVVDIAKNTVIIDEPFV